MGLFTFTSLHAEDFSSATNPSDAGLYTIDTNGSATVETAVTSIINNSNSIDGNSVFVEQAAFEAVVFSFDTVSLDAVGSSLTFSFDLRIVDNAGGQNGLRFGLYNQNGTSVTGDASTESNNDFGYRSGIPFGSTIASDISSSILKEDGSNSLVLTGNDGTNLGSSGTGSRITDANVYRVNFSITRTATGVDLLYETYSGSEFDTLITSISDSDNSDAYTSFNEFAIGSSVGTDVAPFQYVLDNLTVSSIPEPKSSALLLGAIALGSVAAMRRSRR